MRTTQFASVAVIAIVAAFLGVFGAAHPPQSARAADPPPERGVFSVHCRFSHRAPDDPIVHAGMPGHSHSHDFFGNTSTNAFSTLASLLAAPSRCNRGDDHSAYWIPTVSNNGTPVRALSLTAYYRSGRHLPGTIHPFPAGLKLVVGSAAATTPQPIDVVAWGCTGLMTPPTQQVPVCPASERLKLQLRLPDCWNGHDLDSADHKTHMAYSVRSGCPATHPVPVPKVTLNFVVDSQGGPGITLASGGQFSGHADFFNAWRPAALRRLVDACLNHPNDCGATGP